MSANKFLLEIVTPEKLIFKGEVASVVIPGLEGSMGVLPKHTPVLTLIKKGKLTVTLEPNEPDKVNTYNVGEGFSEVLPDKVRVLTEVCE